MKRVPVLALLFLASVAAAGTPEVYPSSQPPRVGMLDYGRRMSLAAIGSYDYQYASDTADPTTVPGKEFAVGLQGQYLLNPTLTLTVQTKYFVDTKQIRSYFGLALPFYGKNRPQAMAVPE